MNKRVPKLIHRLGTLISSLDARNDLRIHGRIDQFYYMTKTEELKILLDEYEKEKKQLDHISGRIEAKYHEIFHNWSRDARWRNSYLRQNN